MLLPFRIEISGYHVTINGQTFQFSVLILRRKSFLLQLGGIIINMRMEIEKFIQISYYFHLI